MKKAVIIGANSFIAKNLAKYLSDKEGDALSLLLYDIQKKDSGMPGNYRQVDFEDRSSLEAIDFDCDAIFFFTGLTGTKRGFSMPDAYVKVNEIYLLNFLSVYVEKKSKAKIVYPSTRLMYASSEEPLREDAEKGFRSIYAVSKYAAENYLETYRNFYGIDYCVLRICVPYGSLLDVAPSYGTYEFFTKQARETGMITVYGDGSSVRTFTHMEDICDALALAADEPRCQGVFNLGGDRKTLAELAGIIAKKYGAAVSFVPFPEEDEKLEVPKSVFDSARLDAILHRSYRKI